MLACVLSVRVNSRVTEAPALFEIFVDRLNSFDDVLDAREDLSLNSAIASG